MTRSTSAVSSGSSAEVGPSKNKILGQAPRRGRYHTPLLDRPKAHMAPCSVARQPHLRNQLVSAGFYCSRGRLSTRIGASMMFFITV